eukprot:Hpha_TRINITY_DN16222_c1_g7::TRINITY_DN16222_c1_g7_i1::g.11267::m.11267
MQAVGRPSGGDASANALSAAVAAGDPGAVEATAQLRQQLQTLLTLQQSGAPHLSASIAEVSARLACAESMLLAAGQVPPGGSSLGVQMRGESPTREHFENCPSEPSESAQPIPVQQPCSHNTWDNVRTKKGQVFLRCRECDAQWRTSVDSLDRCSAFNTAAGCSQGAGCTMLHIHARKQSLNERVQRHGHGVLERVPASTHPEGRAPDERKPGSASPPPTHSDPEAPAPPQSTHGPPPCPHNSWDNVRMKKGQVFLRCRECEVQWRLPGDAINRCASFISAGGCSVGAACPLMHLHPRKQSLNERIAKHGPGVLERTGQQGVDRMVLTLHRAASEGVGCTVKGGLVTKVTEGSPADVAGVQVGMTVLEVNGNPVGTATTDVVTAVRAAWMPGCEMTLTVLPESPPTIPLPELHAIPSASVINQETPTDCPLPGTLSPATGTSGPPPLDDAVSSCPSCASLPATVGDLQLTVTRQRPAEPLGMTVRGNLVTKVTPGSAAAVAGVAKEMRVVQVNGVTVQSSTRAVVAAVKEGWDLGSVQLRLRLPCQMCKPSEDAGSVLSLPSSPAGARSSSRIDTGEEGSIVVVKRDAQDSFGATVKGNRVTRVVPGSACGAVGVAVGMRIAAVNGRSLKSTTVDVVTAIRAAWKGPAGLHVHLTVQIGGDTSSDWERCSSANLSAVSEPRSDLAGSVISGGSATTPPFGSSPGLLGEQEWLGGPEACDHHPLFSVSSFGRPLGWVQAGVNAGPAWLDRAYTLCEVPECLSAAVLLRGPYKAVAQGTRYEIQPAAYIDLYLIHTVAFGRNGGYPQILEDQGWERCDQAPRWAGGAVSRLGMAMWRQRASPGSTIVLPPTTTPETTVVFCAAPVQVHAGRSSASGAEGFVSRTLSPSPKSRGMPTSSGGGDTNSESHRRARSR